MSDRAHVGTKKGLFTVLRGARGWSVEKAAFVGENVSVVLPDARDGTIYVALGHWQFGAKLHRSTDGGATFTEIAVPKYPPQPEGEVDMDPIRKIPIKWSLGLIWALEPGGAKQPGTIWCGTVPGGLFRSDDRGDSWRFIRTLWDKPERKQWMGGGMDMPGMHSIVVDPRDDRHVSVAVSCGGVWITRDGGETWSLCGPGLRNAYLPPDQAGNANLQDVHRLVACAAAPDAMWIQHHNGIFRSTDGAARWNEIHEAGPSTFGFAVAAHPTDPQTAWFVPGVKDVQRVAVDGKLAVTRTRDGGKSFQVLTAGLPQSYAYDLVYRHCLDVDGSGDRLMFGSTTGNLFASDDGGDHWQAVSHHLPPVHCVRFA